MTRAQSAGPSRALTNSKSAPLLLNPNYLVQKTKQAETVFGKGPRFTQNLADHETPGPAYDIDKWVPEKPRGGLIGLEKRFYSGSQKGLASKGVDFAPTSFDSSTNGKLDMNKSNSFGKSMRFSIPAKDSFDAVPGPQYDVTDTIENPIHAVKLGTEKRFRSTRDNNQGRMFNPSSFSSKTDGSLHRNNSVVWGRENRFRASGSQKNASSVPGPKYSIGATDILKTGVKFEQQQRFVDAQPTPGPKFAPSSFVAKPNGKLTRNHSYSFGKSYRFGKDGASDEVPGPHYDKGAGGLKKQSVKIGTEKRFRATGASDGPGPNFAPNSFSRSTSGLLDKNKTCKFSTADRFGDTGAPGPPGPKYASTAEGVSLKTGSSFGKQGRFKSTGTNRSTPGCKFQPGSFYKSTDGRYDRNTSVRWGPPRPSKVRGSAGKNGKSDDGKQAGPNFIPANDRVVGGAMGRSSRFKDSTQKCPYNA